ncbi:MAG: hypothetical protein U1D30_19560 [Planctomycetota bacterium]
MADIRNNAFGLFDGTIYLSREMLEGRNEWESADEPDRLRFLSGVYLHECVHAIHNQQAWHQHDKATGGHCEDFANIANYFSRCLGLPEAVEQDDIDEWPNTMRPDGYFGTIVRKK